MLISTEVRLLLLQTSRWGELAQLSCNWWPRIQVLQFVEPPFQIAGSTFVFAKEKQIEKPYLHSSTDPWPEPVMWS